jgi:hypothetical protein
VIVGGGGLELNMATEKIAWASSKIFSFMLLGFRDPSLARLERKIKVDVSFPFTLHILVGSLLFGEQLYIG